MSDSDLARWRKSRPDTREATFAAGCFWGVELAFSKVEGVVATCVGYTGGSSDYPNPSYQQVCTGQTGHAEAVRVEYDPAKVSYQKLLETFWANHDPTQLNRQGPDVGTQYRSTIYYHNPQQKEEAEASRAALQTRLARYRSVVTEIVEAGPFYPAEQHHQKYLEKQDLAACHI